MDGLASDDPEFRDYVENVIGSDNCNACQAICYGVSKSCQRFALMLVSSLYVYVYMVIEPSGDDISIEPIVSYASFNNKETAIAYMEEKCSELKSKQKIGDLSDFDNFVMEVLKNIRGRELYRIHDFRTQGNLIVIVLKKWFICYKVVIFTNQNDEPRMKYVPGRKRAEHFLQDERNKLKGLHETYVLFDRIDVDKKWLKFNKTLPVSEDMQLLTANNYISDTILKDNPIFAAFVEKSVLSSFRGEEVYRKYGVTHAEQHFCYVVSKIDYFIVHVVLEPSLRLYDAEVTEVDDNDDEVKSYSQTWHLTKVKDRAIVDKFVARDIKQFVDQSGRSFLFENVWMSSTQSCFKLKSVERELKSLERILNRGDHLRRNLNVGIGKLSPTYHDGIYLGNGKVAHYTTDNRFGFFRSKGGSGPGIVSLETFLHGEDTLTVEDRVTRSRSYEQVARVAEYLIRHKFWDKQYNLLKRNCQLFADLCIISPEEYKLQHDAKVDEYKWIAIKLFTWILFFVLSGTSGWYLYNINKISANKSLVAVKVDFLVIILSFIVFAIIGVVWWIQKSSLDKTLQIFVELKNRMESGVSTEEGYENIEVISEDESTNMERLSSHRCTSA